MNILYQKFLLKSIADLLDWICGRYFFLFLYYNIFFYFCQVAAGAIKITVLKEFPPIIFYNKICQKSNSVEKLSKEVFFTRHSSFWTNSARAKLKSESSKFWCGKSYMRALVPGAPGPSCYEKICICELAFAESRGPGSFGIFLRFCEAIVAMKKFAYGVNACGIRAASPKGGPVKLVFGYHFHYNTNRLKCQAKFLKKTGPKSSSYSRSFSNCSL